jgi:uncharacterized coiled-coil protein SlyX
MPAQEERLSTVEQTVVVLGKGIRDIHHNETILLGLVSEQGKDIREMKVSLGALHERLDAFEQSVENRFGTLENRFGTLENRFGTLENRFGVLENRFDTLENRFGVLENRFEEQDKKLDQVLLLLNTLTSKAE